VIVFQEHHENAKENVPTEQQTSRKGAWFPRAHEDARRPVGIESSA
jgi:hypothetical protein